MKEINLTQGQVAIVDDQDFEALNQYKWCALKSSQTYYATRNAVVNGKRTTISMHRKIMGNTEPGFEIDHIDGNGLNNTRQNLRICTHKENTRNRRYLPIGASGFKGVYWNDTTKRWFSSIKTQESLLHIGYFDTKEDAARHYNLAAKNHFGEFAKYNDVSPLFPESPKNVSSKRSKCGLRGVSFNQKTKKWTAVFCINYQRIHLGYFETPELAAMAYDKEAKKHRGELARLNFPS